MALDGPHCEAWLCGGWHYLGPKHVDYHDTHGEYAGTTFLAIYTLEDDVFSFCAGGAGEPRPTAFTTGPGQVLRVMVREA